MTEKEEIKKGPLTYTEFCRGFGLKLLMYPHPQGLREF